VYHPASSHKPNSVYAAPAPYFKKEEEARRFAEWGELFGLRKAARLQVYV
jgi:hypothetical protein